MAWGDAQDYWWLKPKQDNTAAEMQMGAQMRRDAVKLAMEKQEKALEARRTGIAIQKHFDDEAIKNKILDGDKLLTSIFAETTDWSDKTIPQKMGQIAVQHPYVTQGDMWKSMLKFHETAVAETDKYAAMEESRKTREAIAFNTANMRAASTGSNSTVTKQVVDGHTFYQLGRRVVTESELIGSSNLSKLDKAKLDNLDSKQKQYLSIVGKSRPYSTDARIVWDNAQKKLETLQAEKDNLLIDIASRQKPVDTPTSIAPLGPPASAAPGSAANLPPPKRGDIVDGYRYKGGGVNPGDPASWEKVD